MQLFCRTVADPDAARAQPSVADEVAGLADYGLAGVQLPAPFPLWRIAAPNAISPQLLALLSEEERGRAARFHTDPLRHRYCAAHGALRLLGEIYAGVAAKDQRFERNAWGKPRLAGFATTQCSISYSGDSALIAWTTGPEIGVDLEMVRPIEDASDLMTLHYTPGEQTEVLRQGRDPSAFDRSFLIVWVRKEACAKALGKGLGIALSSFDCGVGPGMRTIEIDGRLVDTNVMNINGRLIAAWARCCH